MSTVSCIFTVKQKKKLQDTASTTVLKWQSIKTCMGKSGIDSHICPICSSSGCINSEAPVSCLCRVCQRQFRERKTIHVQLLKKLLPYQQCCGTAENARHSGATEFKAKLINMERGDRHLSNLHTHQVSFSLTVLLQPISKVHSWALQHLSSSFLTACELSDPMALRWQEWQVTSDKEWQETTLAELRYAREDPGTWSWALSWNSNTWVHRYWLFEFDHILSSWGTDCDQSQKKRPG